MSLLLNLRRWIEPARAGAGARVAAAAGAPESEPWQDSGTDTTNGRVPREVLSLTLRMVLRDVQLRAALSPAWVGIEVLDCDGPVPGSRALHARLVLKVWAPRVLASAAQIERLFVKRLRELDPDALRWFGGMSWRLDLPAGQVLDPLPSPYEWMVPEFGDDCGFDAAGSPRGPRELRH